MEHPRCSKVQGGSARLWGSWGPVSHPDRQGSQAQKRAGRVAWASSSSCSVTAGSPGATAGRQGPPGILSGPLSLEGTQGPVGPGNGHPWKAVAWSAEAGGPWLLRE